MSEEPARSSMESSSAASLGLDFEDTALTLRPPGSDTDRKRGASTSGPAGSRTPCASDAPPSAKARVVEWPPVSRNRLNKLKLVKVAVAGAPYHRKVDLEAYAGYDQLLAMLQDKFTAHFTIRQGANEEIELIDVVSEAEYVPTYEDKDGDWMLVGDVPWRMLMVYWICHSPHQLAAATVMVTRRFVAENQEGQFPRGGPLLQVESNTSEIRFRLHKEGFISWRALGGERWCHWHNNTSLFVLVVKLFCRVTIFFVLCIQWFFAIGLM